MSVYLQYAVISIVCIIVCTLTSRKLPVIFSSVAAAIFTALYIGIDDSIFDILAYILVVSAYCSISMICIMYIRKRADRRSKETIKKQMEFEKQWKQHYTENFDSYDSETSKNSDTEAQFHIAVADEMNKLGIPNVFKYHLEYDISFVTGLYKASIGALEVYRYGFEVKGREVYIEFDSYIQMFATMKLIEATSGLDKCGDLWKSISFAHSRQDSWFNDNWHNYGQGSGHTGNGGQGYTWQYADESVHIPVKKTLNDEVKSKFPKEYAEFGFDKINLSDKDAIKSFRRSLMRKNHPDRFNDAADKERQTEIFKRINTVFDFIQNYNG